MSGALDELAFEDRAGAGEDVVVEPAGAGVRGLGAIWIWFCLLLYYG